MRDLSPSPAPAADRLETVAARAAARAWGARLPPSSPIMATLIEDEAEEVGLPERDLPAALDRATELLLQRIGRSDAA